MFGGLIIFLLLGFPVACSLAALGLFFGVIAIKIGYFTLPFLQALPYRIFGIMSNELLLAMYDWSLMERNAGLVRFVGRLVAFRKAHRVLGAGRFYTDKEISWFGVEGHAPEWHRPENRLGCVIGQSGSGAGGAKLCLLFNATLTTCRFALPETAAPWRVAVDTSKSSPEDIAEPGEEVLLPDLGAVTVSARSTAILVTG